MNDEDRPADPPSGFAELSVALHKFGIARAALAEAMTEFGRQRRTAEAVRRRRLIETDPTFVPYRFESAEARAERRRKLHATTDEGDE